MQSEILIQTLISRVGTIVGRVETLRREPASTWVWREHPGAWNILECLEHLNLYGEYYLPQIEKRIEKTTVAPDANFRPGWLGDYFAASMLPGPKMKKMKTFKDKDPRGTDLDALVFDRFFEQQGQLLELLRQSSRVNLGRIRIPTSISPLLRLKLGDTFRFYVNHMFRHLDQMERIAQGAKADVFPINRTYDPIPDSV